MDTVLNRLSKRTIVKGHYNFPTCAIEEWYIILHRMITHVYAPIPSITSPRASKSNINHQYLFHPSVEKKLKIIRRASPEEENYNTHHIMEDFTARRDRFQ